MNWTVSTASILLAMHAVVSSDDVVRAADVWPSFSTIKDEWDEAEAAHGLVKTRAKTSEERQAAGTVRPDPAEFAERFLRIAEADPGTRDELFSLCWASLNAPDSEPGKRATARLVAGRIERADLSELREAFEQARTSHSLNPRPLVPATLSRIKRSLEHPDAPRLLAWICAAYKDDEGPTAPEPFREAADLIGDRFAESADISHFCESLFLRGRRPWADEFEKHLRTIIEKNKTPLVRVTSEYALALGLRNGTANGEKRAEDSFRKFVAGYGGHKGGVEQLLVDEARQELAKIECCGIGKAAPDIDGKDLDGNPTRLSEQKGNVVLLVFWASWCAPCMEEIPHENELVERFAGRPFVLLGVNGDLDKRDAKTAVEKAGISFRSLWNGGMHGRFTKAWAVDSWPSVFVIDHEGIIRHNDLSASRLNEPLQALVAKAESAAKRTD